VSGEPHLLVVVGAGGVGKTTLAAALGLLASREPADTLVMTFDPSLRLKDALGVGDEARRSEVEVEAATRGRLFASLLDARDTFDRLIARYAPDEPARRRIVTNRYYDKLSGALAGVLEYMAVERLFEVAGSGRFGHVVLDTPPTRQALDFLEAPQRIVAFLESGALRLALRPWFDATGRLRPTRHLGLLGRNVESLLDRVVGLEVLREMAEFFQAFAPLFEGFRRRAAEVQDLLRSPRTAFVLVCGPGEEQIPDTLYFARRLAESGHRIEAVVVNRVQPALRQRTAQAEPLAAGERLLAWRGERDRRGVAALRGLLGSALPLVEVPVLDAEPTNLGGLARLADLLADGRLGRLVGAGGS